MGKEKPNIRLLEAETLLWTGAPQKRPPYPKLVIGMLCLYVFLMLSAWFIGGAAIILRAFVELITIPQTTWVNIGMAVFLLGFLWLGCFINVLRLMNRERWHYALTDQRLLMISRLLGVEIEYAASINSVEAAQTSTHRDGLTSLTFVTPHVRISSRSWIPLAWLLGISELNHQIAFHSIASDDAHEIYIAVDELREFIGDDRVE